MRSDSISFRSAFRSRQCLRIICLVCICSLVLSSSCVSFHTAIEAPPNSEESGAASTKPEFSAVIIEPSRKEMSRKRGFDWRKTVVGRLEATNLFSSVAMVEEEELSEQDQEHTFIIRYGEISLLRDRSIFLGISISLLTILTLMSASAIPDIPAEGSLAGTMRIERWDGETREYSKKVAFESMRSVNGWSRKWSSAPRDYVLNGITNEMLAEEDFYRGK